MSDDVKVDEATSDDNAIATTEEIAETKESTDEGEQKETEGGMLEGEKEPEGEPEKVVAPETYEAFTKADGSALDEKSQTEFDAVAKEFDLTQTQAQGIVAADEARQQTLAKQYEAQDASNREAIKKKYADGFREADVIANTAFKTFFENEEHREALTNAGVTADPDFFDAMVKLGKTIGEDSFVKGGDKVKGKSDRSLADSLQDPD